MKKLTVVVLAVFAALAPTAQATTPASEHQAAAAVRSGPTAVRAALTRARQDRNLAESLLRRGTVQRTSGSSGVSTLDWSKGCRAQYWSKHRFVVAGVWLATNKVTQNGFCWRVGRITQDSGVSSYRKAAPGFCWIDPEKGITWLWRYQDGPWITPDKKRAFTAATFGFLTSPACIPNKFDKPTVTYTGFGGRVAR